MSDIFCFHEKEGTLPHWHLLNVVIDVLCRVVELGYNFKMSSTFMNSLLRLSSRCCRRNNHVTSKTSLQTQNSTRIVGGRLLSEDEISQHGALFSTRLGLGTMWRYMIMYVENVDINTSTPQFAPRPRLLVRALFPCFAIPLHLHLAKCFPFYAPCFQLLRAKSGKGFE